MAKVINIGAGGGSSDAELVVNKTTTIDESSTDIQYPSAKAVYDFVFDMAGLPIKDDLDNMSWADIREVSKAKQGENYFSVGDVKKIKLNGTIGTFTANNLELYVYILGFNHNSRREGNGITFGSFKIPEEYEGETYWTDVALCNSDYNSTLSDGTKTFNMNHWGNASASPYNTNYGGWAGCDLRYDILGSTNVAPSGYESMPLAPDYDDNDNPITSHRFGYNPNNYDIVNNPVENTLMSALPQELRAVMQPIIKYTDNMGGGSNIEDNISSTIDYLVLLAEYEIFGSRTRANVYEKDYQEQYAYYIAGNSKVKYNHSDTSSAVGWWERSPNYGSAYYFCNVSNGGGAFNIGSRYSRGLAPAFKV